MASVTAEEIEKALDARVLEMRSNYGREPHVSIEYINGFEDAASLVADLIEKASAHVDR
jgi:hypothetical protein